MILWLGTFGDGSALTASSLRDVSRGRIRSLRSAIRMVGAWKELRDSVIVFVVLRRSVEGGALYARGVLASRRDARSTRWCPRACTSVVCSPCRSSGSTTGGRARCPAGHGRPASSSACDRRAGRTRRGPLVAVSVAVGVEPIACLPRVSLQARRSRLVRPREECPIRWKGGVCDARDQLTRERRSMVKAAVSLARLAVFHSPRRRRLLRWPGALLRASRDAGLVGACCLCFRPVR